MDHHGGCKNFYWRGVLNFDSENTEFFSVLGSFHKLRNNYFQNIFSRNPVIATILVPKKW